MAIDPSVIFGANQSQPPNPLAMAGQIAQTQNALLQARSNMQQLQARTAIGQAYQQASDPNTGAIDYGRLQSLIQADPRAAWMAPQITQGIQEQQKRQFDLQQQALAQTTARTGVFASAAAPLLRLGANVQPTDLYGVVNRLHAGGIPTDEIVRQMAASMPVQQPGEAPDPSYGAKLHDWITNVFGANMTPAEAAKTFLPAPSLVNTGGTQQTYDANPVTNPGATNMAFRNTLDPAGQARQVTGPLGGGGAPTVISQSAYAQGQGLGALVPGTVAPSLFGGVTGRVPAALMGPGSAPGQGGATLPVDPTATPVQATPTPAPAAAPGPMVTGLGPGQDAGLKAAGDASAAQWANLQNSVGGTAAGGGSAGRIYTLQHSLDLLQRLGTTGTGPSSPQTQAITSYVQSIPGVGPLANGLGIANPQNIANYDEANKLLTAYAAQRAGARGGTTDSQLATTLSSNASTHISNLAAQDVVKANIGLERMDQAQAAAFQGARDPSTGQPLTPDQFSNWSANWNQSMDPRAFVADQLTPQQFSSTVSGMAPADQAKFKATFNTAIQNGWMQPPAWMQGSNSPAGAAAPSGPSNAYVDPVTGLQPGPQAGGQQ